MAHKLSDQEQIQLAVGSLFTCLARALEADGSLKRDTLWGSDRIRGPEARQDATTPYQCNRYCSVSMGDVSANTGA
jgi:hypothetical protein